MITKHNTSAYADLFAKATKILNTYGDGEYKTYEIHDLDDYFACLRTLATIERDHPEDVDPIFTILPATEELFVIDANTRQINIPKSITKDKTWVPGIQGDDIAEILYFSIDRYFDAMDLAEMDIIIQWQPENSSSGLLAATYKKSLTLQPGKIVFGWPLTSEITASAGKVKFSVRFYRRELNKTTNQMELIYSFSTSTAEITIQPGLNIELSDSNLQDAIGLYTQNYDRIYHNLRNSEKFNPEYNIAIPQFTNYYVITKDEEEEDIFSEAAEDLVYDLPITFISKAEIPSNTADKVSATGISYSWKKNDKTVESSHYYKAVTSDMIYNKNEIYYYLNDKDGVAKYEVYSTIGDDDPLNDGVPLYVRCSQFEPTTAGTYIVEASNNFALGENKVTQSKVWTVPGPSLPTITSLLTYNYAILNEGPIKMSIEADGVAKSEWQYRSSDDTNAEFKALGEVANINEDKICEHVAENEGYYRLKVINTKNNSSIDEVSEIIEVWSRATEPTISVNASQIEINSDFIIGASNDNKGTLSYQWYKMNNDGTAQIIADESSNFFTPTSAGFYKCVVTNTYKYTSAEKETEWLIANPSST